jgi:uncharacterized damage-inducible protein DinB
MSEHWSQSLKFSLAHSRWAMQRLLAASEQLSPAQFEQDMGIGPGSLRATLAHVIEAMFFFADNFAGRPYHPRDDFDREAETIAGLRRLLARADAELRRDMLAAAGGNPAQTVQWPNAESGTLPTPVAVAQVFDHACLHRTQCINMLKRLGVLPVLDLDPMSFHASGESWD